MSSRLARGLVDASAFGHESTKSAHTRGMESRARYL